MIYVRPMNIVQVEQVVSRFLKVMEDMTLWWAVLRLGGLMACHDYISAAQSQEEGQREGGNRSRES